MNTIVITNIIPILCWRCCYCCCCCYCFYRPRSFFPRLPLTVAFVVWKLQFQEHFLQGIVLQVFISCCFPFFPDHLFFSFFVFLFACLLLSSLFFSFLFCCYTFHCVLGLVEVGTIGMAVVRYYCSHTIWSASAKPGNPIALLVGTYTCCVLSRRKTEMQFYFSIWFILILLYMFVWMFGCLC